MNAQLNSDDTDTVITATQTWLERAVIGLNLCPFARAVHVNQRVRYCVSGALSTVELLKDLSSEPHTLQEGI